MMLQIRQLYKTYRKFVALDHIDLTVEEGDIFGFVGPNGAGKTTTMRILATLMKPTGGEAFIDGISVTENPKAIRKIIGYMPDFFGVYDDLKVHEYLDFYSRAAGLSYQEGKKNSEELLELVYLSDKKETYVDTLSRGMKQRLCLARSLIGNPRLLILDEPASGMDPRARIEMKMILKTLKEMKKTILISSHILPELAELCDTVGILERGRFQFVGSLAEIGEKMHGGKLISIRCRSMAEELMLFLREQPNVGNIDREENSLRVSFSGDEEDTQRLLYALVERQFPVISFSLEQENLENVFLEVTKNA